jgi:hypothetical protein
MATHRQPIIGPTFQFVFGSKALSNRHDWFSTAYVEGCGQPGGAASREVSQDIFPLTALFSTAVVDDA